MGLHFNRVASAYDDESYESAGTSDQRDSRLPSRAATLAEAHPRSQARAKTSSGCDSEPPTMSDVPLQPSVQPLRWIRTDELNRSHSCHAVTETKYYRVDADRRAATELRDQEVGSLNPLAPTIDLQELAYNSS